MLRYLSPSREWSEAPADLAAALKKLRTLPSLTLLVAADGRVLAWSHSFGSPKKAPPFTVDPGTGAPTGRTSAHRYLAELVEQGRLMVVRRGEYTLPSLPARWEVREPSAQAHQLASELLCWPPHYLLWLHQAALRHRQLQGDAARRQALERQVCTVVDAVLEEPGGAEAEIAEEIMRAAE